MFNLRDFSTVLFDIDGVLCQGARVLPGARELVAFLDANAIRYACVTNSATLTPNQRAFRLSQMGLTIDAAQIVTSAQAARNLLDKDLPEGTGILAIGMDGLHEALLGDHKFVTDEIHPRVVVASHDDHLTYEKCRRAVQAIQSGAAFIATNPDVLVPSEDGLIPETGALIAYLEAASGVKAHVVGKPSPHMFRLAVERLGANGATLMIGDRLDTDIAGAQAAGFASALVMTGVTDDEALRHSEHQPDAVFPDLTSLLAAWQQ